VPPRQHRHFQALKTTEPRLTKPLQLVAANSQVMAMTAAAQICPLTSVRRSTFMLTASVHRLTQGAEAAHLLSEAIKTVAQVFNHLLPALLLITLGVALQPLMTAILQELEALATQTLAAGVPARLVSLAP
jgi:hypothetical protein